MKLKSIILKIVFVIFFFTVNACKTKKEDSIITGIDISRYQGNISWEMLVKDNQLSFVIAKATEGKNDIDPTFKYNWLEINKMKLVKGAYHFYINEDDPLLQANLYLEAVKFQKKDLPPILDVEGFSIKRKSENLKENCLLWLERVKKSTGKMPIIYSNYSFFNEQLNDTAFTKYPIWIAEYNSLQKPKVPKLWNDWLFWQKSNNYILNGISGDVDYDIFNGNSKDFYEFINNQ